MTFDILDAWWQLLYSSSWLEGWNRRKDQWAQRKRKGIKKSLISSRKSWTELLFQLGTTKFGGRVVQQATRANSKGRTSSTKRKGIREKVWKSLLPKML